MQFGSIAARRARGVSTYAERSAQANAAQSNVGNEAGPQRKRQSGYEDSFGQSL